jgi:hypothetical protein
MSILLYILPILFIVRIFNHYRSKNLDLKAENDVRALRNKLRWSAIEGKKIKKHPGFIHVDYVIARSEPEIKRINIWVIFYEVAFKKRRNKQLERNYSTGTYFSDNLELKQFYNDYADITLRYLIRRSLFTLFILAITMKITKNVSSRVTRFIANTKQNLRLYLLQQNERYAH